MDFTYIDLFSWAWWFSLGFEKAWYKNIFSIDFEKSYCETYRKNFPKHTLIEKDISKLSDNEVIELVGNQKVDVIIWWPPCQGFSMAWSIWRNFIDDPRNHLFLEFARIVSIVQPEIFVMENVARLFTHNNWKTKEQILDKFHDLGYTVTVDVVNMVNYWVPQKRSRVIFIWTKSGERINVPRATNSVFKSIKDAIGHFPRLESGEKSNIPNHEAMNHSEQMLFKMSHLKDWWNREQIPEEIRPKSWDIRKYIRYNSNDPSICITWDMRKVFHYSQNRSLTVRELAAIQSFPDDFQFCWSKISQQQQVWNSVPPLFATILAKYLKDFQKNAKKK